MPIARRLCVQGKGILRRKDRALTTLVFACPSRLPTLVRQRTAGHARHCNALRQHRQAGRNALGRRQPSATPARDATDLQRQRNRGCDLEPVLWGMVFQSQFARDPSPHYRPSCPEHEYARGEVLLLQASSRAFAIGATLTSGPVSWVQLTAVRPAQHCRARRVRLPSAPLMAGAPAVGTQVRIAAIHGELAHRPAEIGPRQSARPRVDGSSGRGGGSPR